MTPEGGNTEATANFSGSRWGLLGVLAPGYVLMLFTLGIYRFWQVTAKRRYYWAHTAIDGDTLEYTGTAIQLLVGFLIAVAFFLPLYGFFFYLSTQSAEIAVVGYVGALVLLYFLGGYAIYRARRFGLSRTLWRGVRLGQSGNAWAYALRRFGWSLVVIVTVGLAYPFMAAGLWRYRYNNTWYGDRKFSFNGSWRTIAWPFYRTYALIAVLVIVAVVVGVSSGEGPGAEIGRTLMGMVVFAVAGLGLIYLKARINSRFLSSLAVGRAAIRVRIKARSLFLMYLFYGAMLTVAIMVLVFAAGWMFADLFEPLSRGEEVDFGDVLGLGWGSLVVMGLMYLLLLATWAALAETILGLGYWRLVARGAVIEDGDDLRTVRAHGGESPVVGEGLADALNVGGY